MIWSVRGPREFRALSNARRQRLGPLVLSCCRATEPGPPRVAYAIGRRSGGAVERNRIRRRLRPLIVEHAALLRPDYQYLVGASASALRAPRAELDQAWTGLLDRVHGVAS